YLEPGGIAEALRQRRRPGDVLEHQRHGAPRRLDSRVLGAHMAGYGLDRGGGRSARDTLHLELEAQRLLERWRHLHLPELRDGEVEVLQSLAPLIRVVVEEEVGEPKASEGDFRTELDLLADVESLVVVGECCDGTTQQLTGIPEMSAATGQIEGLK